MAIYVNLMEVDLNTSEIMKNFNSSERTEFTYLDLSVEKSELIVAVAVKALYPSLSEHVFINMDLNDDLLSALDQRITSENFYIIQELLMKGADPNTTNSSGNRPIHLAILRSPKNIKLVIELIRLGADVNVVNKHGSTPLTVSLYNRCHQTTALLIKKGIDLNFQCQRGWTALMIASMIGDLWSVRTLLQHGANVNIYDINKKTALMFAVDGKYFDVIKELLEYGANPGMRNVANKTALHICLERIYPDLDVVNLLLLHCASFDDLEINPEASFRRIMNICLRGGPEYHICVKTIIKIQMLLTNDYHCVTSYEEFYDFALMCCAEIRYMSLYDISKCKTVATLLQKCLRGYMPKERELEALLPFVANNRFSIYADILRALVRKSYLRKKFMKMLMYVKREGQADEIILNSDIHIRILSYLSDDDVSSFVISSYIKKNSQDGAGFKDSSLYPTGLTYNFNDLTTS
ncbi:serine/threonine-protein kinase TNNI3K-like [Argiope bruennichi]|uniref:serine/threonine-protein kinase TNNI3K-like n=1 Tax=Argiope bruennichi TaxID=94029 RepID=UPI00249426F8|nr:serine/threonine-protein kinase TNNI3K-like [Argiope bruennichi]